MGIWGNFQREKCQYLSYTDVMEEPMLDRKKLIENHPGEDSCRSCCDKLGGETGWHNKGAICHFEAGLL